MGFKKVILNTLAHFKKQNSQIPLAKPKTLDLWEVLSGISLLNATSNTPKSRLNLVYNFGEQVDVMLAFARMDGGRVEVSKGLSAYQGKRFLSLEEWNQLDQIEQDIKLASQKDASPVLLLNSNEKTEELFCQLLELVDQWAASNYPLIIGIDAFKNLNRKYFDISSLKLLSAVQESTCLKFVFYYRGYCNIEFLDIPLRTAPSTEIPSGFFEGSSNQEKYLNSMIELRNLLESADSKNSEVYKEILVNANLSSTQTSSIAISKLRKRKMNIYDNTLKQFLFKSNVKYRMGYCLESGGTYVEFLENERRFNTTERHVLVTRDTVLMLNGELANKISKIKINECKPPNIKLYEGVPGSGKSRFIVSEHTPGKDLVLTQTRASIKDIRDAIVEKYGQQYIDRLNTDYRTVASFIINHTWGKTYNRVFIDEALLMHAGYLGYVAKLSGATEIIAVGDSKQIPYIERSRLKAKWCRITDFCDSIEKISITQRCPIDVCYALSPHYTDIATTNIKPLSVLPIGRCGDFHQIEPDTLVLTFTQEEKLKVGEVLKCKNNLRIHTIHEAQGLSSKRVVLLRIDYRKNDIYNSMPHAIVALSRHTETFRYLTTGTEDAVETLLNRLKHINGRELIKWNANRISKVENNTPL